MSKAVELRDYFRQTKPDEKPPTFTDILVRAAALAISDLPWANVSSYAEGPQVRETVDIGVVVKTDAGLAIPVVRSADRKSLASISKEVRELATKAREGRLTPGETGTKSMTISNAGMYGVDIMYPIIDMPDPLICGVGALRENAVPTGAGIQAVPQLMLSLSVDHRVFDGADAGRILEAMALRVEQPFEIVGAP
jgi:pyruvate dehydrogenase E2 component (dihydrolipoamide acetyltransferase)